MVDRTWVERVCGAGIADEGIYRQALTHSSFINEYPDRGLTSNERLEFLGDAVLQLITSEFLYREFPDLAEGELTRLRAALVSTPTLAERGKALGFGDHLLLGRGEELSGGRGRPSILENAFEAFVGAVYIDRGLAAARDFILRSLEAEIGLLAREGARRDWKTELQEALQRQGLLPEYRLLAASGPDHAKVFEAAVAVRGRELGRGRGRSIKEAEQEAAREALTQTELTPVQREG